MKKLVASCLLSVLVGLLAGTIVLASSGGIPMPGQKPQPKSQPQPQPEQPPQVEQAVPPQQQPVSVPQTPTPQVTAPETTKPARPAFTKETSEELQRRRALISKRKEMLNNTSWEIDMVPLDGKGKQETDVILFYDRKVSTENLARDGFLPTNFTLTLKEDGKTEWETMQSKENEVVFFKGELSEEFDTMSGVISFQKLEGNLDYSFTTTSKRQVTPPKPPQAQE